MPVTNRENNDMNIHFTRRNPTRPAGISTIFSIVALVAGLVPVLLSPSAVRAQSNLDRDEITEQYDAFNRTYEGFGYWDNANSSHPGEPVRFVLSFQDTGETVTLSAEITEYIGDTPVATITGTSDPMPASAEKVFRIGESYYIDVTAELTTASNYVTPLIILRGTFHKSISGEDVGPDAIHGQGYFEIEKEVPLDLGGSEDDISSDLVVVGLIAVVGLTVLVVARKRRSRRKNNRRDGADDSTADAETTRPEREDERDDEGDDEQEGPTRVEASVEPSQVEINDRNGATLFTTVYCNPRDPQREKKELSNITVATGGGYDEWTIVDSAPADEWDDYRRFYITFQYRVGSEFYSADEAGLEFPVTIPLTATLNGQPGATQTVHLDVVAEGPELVSYPESMVLLPGASDEVRVMVKNPGSRNWELGYEIEGTPRTAVSLQPGPTSNHTFVYKIAADDVDLEPGESFRHEIAFIARSGEAELRTTMVATVMSEGVIVLTAAPLRVKADVDTVSELLITAVYVAEGRLQTDYDTLLNLGFEINGESMLTERAFENAQLIFEQGDMRDAGEIETARGLPPDVKVLPFRVRSKTVLPGRLSDRFNADLHYFADCPRTGKMYHDTIPLEMVCFIDYPDDLDKQVEYEHVIDVIRKGIVPDDLKDRFLRIVYDRADLLGAEGLRTLRKQIIRTSMKHWQTISLRQEHNELVYRDYEQILNWVDWAGSIAFNVLVGIFAGPLAAALQSIGKDLIVSAIKSHVAGRSAEQWLDEQWDYLKWQAPDQVITILAIKKKISSPSVYILCVVWMFYRNLSTKQYDIKEAAWQSAKDVGVMALTMFLTGMAMRSAGKHGYRVDDALREEYENRRRNGRDTDPADEPAATAVGGRENGVDPRGEDFRMASELFDDLKRAGTEADTQARRKVGELTDAVRRGDEAQVKEAGLRVFEDQNAILEVNNQAGLSRERAAINDVMDGFRSRAIEKTKRALSQKYGASPSDIEVVKGTNKARPGDVANKSPADLDYMIKIDGKEVNRFEAAEVFDRFFYDELNSDPVGRKFVDGRTPKDVSQIFDNHAMGWDDPEFYWDTKSLKNPDKAYSVGLNYSEKHAENMAWAIDYKNNHHFSEGARLRRLGRKTNDPTCYVNSETAMKQGIRTFNKQVNKQIQPKIDALEAAYRKMQDVSPGTPVDRLRMDPDLAKGLEIMQSGKTPVEIEMELRTLSDPNCRTFAGISKMAGNYLMRMNHELFHTRKQIAHQLLAERVRKQKAERSL